MKRPLAGLLLGILCILMGLRVIEFKNSSPVWFYVIGTIIIGVGVYRFFVMKKGKP